MSRIFGVVRGRIENPTYKTNKKGDRNIIFCEWYGMKGETEGLEKMYHHIGNYVAFNRMQ